MTPSLGALGFSWKVRADRSTNRPRRSLDLSNRQFRFLSNEPLFPCSAPPLLKTANGAATSTNRRAARNRFERCRVARRRLTAARSVHADSNREGKTIDHPRQASFFLDLPRSFSLSLSLFLSFSLACVCPVSLEGPEKQNSRGEKGEYGGVCLLVGALLG